MNLANNPIIGGVAANQLAQKVAEKATERQQAAQQSRADASARNAEKSVGEMEQQHGSTDRDADGRRLREQLKDKPEREAGDEDANEQKNRDATGDRGEQLDLMG